MSQDEIFVRFVYSLFVVMILFGLIMTIILIFGDERIGVKMLNVFSSMFFGVLGFGSGYLLGRGDRELKKNGEGVK